MELKNLLIYLLGIHNSKYVKKFLIDMAFDTKNLLKSPLLSSLTAKSVLGKNKKLPLGRIFLASKTQAHKHPHHDRAICPFRGMVLLAEHISPLGASEEGIDQSRRQRVLVETIN